MKTRWVKYLVTKLLTMRSQLNTIDRVLLSDKKKTKQNKTKTWEDFHYVYDTLAMVT